MYILWATKVDTQLITQNNLTNEVFGELLKDFEAISPSRNYEIRVRRLQ